MKQRISVADVQEGNPLDAWHSWLSDELCPCAVRDYIPEAFSAECEIADVGEVRLAQFRGSRQTFERPRSLIKPSNSDDYVFSIFNVASSAFEHNGYNKQCRSGDAVLIDSARPHVFAHDQNVEILNILVPRHLLVAALGATDVAAGVVLHGGEPTTDIIAAYLKALLLTADDLAPSTARRMGLTAVDLIAAGFDDRLSRTGQRHRQSVLLVRAQAFLDDHLADRELEPAMVAAALGVSLRRLHEVFLAEGWTMMDFLWERRLLRAEKLLRHDKGHRVPVSTIAYRAGFTSPAHFSRRFKSRFGVTPTEFRPPMGASGAG